VSPAAGWRGTAPDAGAAETRPRRPLGLSGPGPPAVPRLPGSRACLVPAPAWFPRLPGSRPSPGSCCTHLRVRRDLRPM